MVGKPDETAKDAKKKALSAPAGAIDR